MMFNLPLKIFFPLTLLLLINNKALAQVSTPANWSSVIERDYRVKPNITYLKANNIELKLDIYAPKNKEKLIPTLIYFHGGGWISGEKEEYILNLLPFWEMGFAVVNVEYRLANVSHAPAAVEDCLCALRWVIKNSDKFGFDTNKIVLSGISAGGHLALITGMIPADSGFDNQCYGEEKLKVAAIINWFGITDVKDLIEGENKKFYALQWIGNTPDRIKIAEQVSPINYIRSDLPPILTIHGDADTVVPYNHAILLHQELEKAKVPHQLITIPNRGHGGFTKEETLNIYDNIREFLSIYVLNKNRF